MIGLVDILEDYEAGYLDRREQLELFAELIRTGQAWHLPQHYVRVARMLIAAGYITPAGKIILEAHEGAVVQDLPEDQRLYIGGADETVPGPFATPNVNA